jgi:sugar phosphate isomerase/epimerase
VVPYDLLLHECDPKLVQMEIDIFWMVKGKHDPVKYFAQYPGRFPMVHVKDMTRSGDMVDVGRGAIDFAAIFRQGKIQHFFVEHDEPTAPMDDARISYEYLRRLEY